ncbi:MAG TPA: alpha/beta fold hydrolase [Solirubrobacteraceae bacterium]
MRATHHERRAFAAALAVLLVHALDDAFVHRGAGVPPTRHLAAGLLAALVCGLAGAFAGRLRPGLQAALAAALGVPAVVNGAMHAVHAWSYGPEPADVTGLAALLGGVALLALAVVVPWRHRRERPASFKVRAAALVLAPLAVVVVLVPVAVGLVEVHDFRVPVGSPPDASYASVTFRATDGLRLSGWYRASRNGAAVLLVHGGGGNRVGALRQARMLAAHGYGVLLYDSRGSGRSEGARNTWDWGWEKDAAGALRFLERRGDVHDGRIGALGLSSGADTLVDLAADHPALRAVVADGTALRTFEDADREFGAPFTMVTSWLSFATTRVLAGTAPSRPLEDLARRVRAPLLLISAGRDAEWRLSRRYAAAAGRVARHWNLPDARHTGAVRSHSREYERRVVAFFDRAL